MQLPAVKPGFAASLFGRFAARQSCLPPWAAGCPHGGINLLSIRYQ